MRICRYLIEINGAQAIIHQGDAEKALEPKDVSLSLDDILVIKEQKVSIGDLLDALIDYNEEWLLAFFDERGQYETGVYLYRQLFGNATAEVLQKNCDEVELRIIATDENISRLPWMLLAHKGVFLSTAGWSISLAIDTSEPSHELPPSPKILVVIPQPLGWGNTEAQNHISELQELIASADVAYATDSCFKTAGTWLEFLTHLNSFQPDIFYYYGHGTGDRHKTRLIFADENNRAVEKPVADVLAGLRNTQTPPLLAYINCCQGDAGGLLGVGKQLAAFIPAVVTNRTTAFISAARAQAMEFWKAVLLQGLPPHKAVSIMRGRLGNLNLSTADTRWMTPVLHRGYGDWHANPPSPPSRLERDPHWQLKLGRAGQFGKVFLQTYQMFKERKPRALAYLWYGTQEQGMEIFHRRLSEVLPENLPDIVLYEVRPVWPDDLHDPPRSFSDMLCQAFRVSGLDHLSGRIRTQGRQITGKRILVYISHQPVDSPLKFDPKHINTYLEWWSRNFVPLLPETAHALLGISFEVTKPAKFFKLLTEREGLHELILPDCVFELLDEFEKVTKRDLLAFIQTHNIELPVDIKEKILEELLGKTEGSYIKLLDELRQLESRAWRKRFETKGKYAKSEATHVPYVVKIEADPEVILLGGRTTIMVELEPYGDDPEAPRLEVPARESDIGLFLQVPPGFKCVGDNALSLPLEPTFDENVPQERGTQRAHFLLLATDLVPEARVVVEFLSKSGLQKEFPLTLRVEQVVAEAFESEHSLMAPCPVPHPDLLLEVQPERDASGTRLTFNYLLEGPALPEGGIRAYHSKPVAAEWSQHFRCLLAAIVSVGAGAAPEEVYGRMAGLGQETAYQLCPPELWQALTARGVHSLLVLAPEGAWQPWELLHDGHQFLGERLIIGRWPRGLSDLRTYEFAVGEIKIAHYAGVDQPGAWRRLLRPLKAPAAELLSGGTLPDNKSAGALRGLHLLRRGRRPDEIDSSLPRLRKPGNDHGSGQDGGPISLGQSKLNLRSNRPLVSLGFLEAGVPGLTELERHWAAAFVSAGASAFVGPQWMVTPEVEAAFVRGFYDGLWAGHSLGDAFRLGQRLARAAAPDTVDWMAYVLYGDPMARAYRPVEGEGYAVVEAVGREIDEPVGPGEAVRFRLGLRRSPPVWHTDRLVEVTEALNFKDLTVRVVAPGLQATPDTPSKMTKIGEDYLGWVTLTVPDDHVAGTVTVEFYFVGDEQMVHMDTLSLTIEGIGGGGRQ